MAKKVKFAGTDFNFGANVRPKRSKGKKAKGKKGRSSRKGGGS